MRLADLEPEFLKRVTEDRSTLDVTIAEADGIVFVCPKCFAANGNQRPGVHSIICWRPRVPADVTPGPGRWEFIGTCLDDLSLVAGSSSVLLMGGCNAHFFVRNGAIEMA